uniref:J domain-containing protein n=1 Tax=Neobodo designis TaxID=312471 RepID=A0A7S1QIS7_NEODS|mmetsp:Transcript_46162/g.142305  ORF Transcript_46162/g.142305 Transcript_46162/m.142305 type:complete len:680 (+) Transcript_46162:85-2124(+)
MTHYKILGVTRKSTKEEIVTAYRRRALQCHPDKPGGSAELFNRLKVAYDTLQDATKRAAYDSELAEVRRKRNFRPPPPIDNPRMPEAFLLPDGTTYVFETAPDRLKCKFRHGDVVRHTDGEQGVFVGIAGDGLFYWCPMSTKHAVPLNTFGGEKDIAVLFRQQAPSSTGAARGRMPSRSAPRPGHGSFSASFASATSANAERADRAAASRMDAELKRRVAEEEKLEKQRIRRFNGAIAQIVTEESARRYTLVRTADRYWENANADFKRAADRISRRYRGSTVPPSAGPRDASCARRKSGAEAENQSGSPGNASFTSATTASPPRRQPGRTSTPSRATGAAATRPVVTPAAYRSVRPRLFSHLAVPPVAAVPRRSASPDADPSNPPAEDAATRQEHSNERRSSSANRGHTPRSTQAREIPSVNSQAPLSPPTRVRAGSGVAPLNLSNVRAGMPEQQDDTISPSNVPLEAPRTRHADPASAAPLQQDTRSETKPAPEKGTASQGRRTTPRPGPGIGPAAGTRTASKSATASTLRRPTSEVRPRAATPRSSAAPAAPALHSVRINNAFLQRRGTAGTGCAAQLDDEHREEYDTLVREAMRRQTNTPRRNVTPSAQPRRMSSTVRSQRPAAAAGQPEGDKRESGMDRHPKSPEGSPAAPTGHRPPDMLQSVKLRRRASEAAEN